jgi:hypothetical protein
MKTVRVIVAVILAVVVYAGCGDASESAATVAVRAVATDELSYESYARTLADRVDDEGWVDYAALKDDAGDLETFLANLAGLDRGAYESWDEAAKIAFWTNAYNALTLKAIIDNYPIEPSALRSITYPKNSIRQIPGVWKKLLFTVMGEAITLDRIEHGVLRVEFDEPRIHMALVCAAVSCPPLRNEPFTGERLDAQLQDQTVRFLDNPAKFRVERDTARVWLSSIFDWFGEDFVSSYGGGEGFEGRGDSERAVLRFVAAHLDDRDREFLEANEFSVEYLDYDWTLNDKATSR